MIWKTEEFGANCEQAAVPTQAELDQGQDFIVYKCANKLGPPMWQTFHEGTRMSIGFGAKPHDSIQGIATDRGDWPLSWGGRMEGEKFVAEMVIARFTSVGEEPPKQRLVVIRLLENGISCDVGSAEPSPAQNDVARGIAMKHRTDATCENEPTLYDWLKAD